MASAEPREQPAEALMIVDLLKTLVSFGKRVQAVAARRGALAAQRPGGPHVAVADQRYSPCPARQRPWGSSAAPPPPPPLPATCLRPLFPTAFRPPHSSLPGHQAVRPASGGLPP